MSVITIDYGDLGIGLEEFPIFTPTQDKDYTFTTSRVAKAVIVACQFSQANGGCIFYVYNVESDIVKLYYVSQFDITVTIPSPLKFAYDKNTLTFTYHPYNTTSYAVPTKVMWC